MFMARRKNTIKSIRDKLIYRCAKSGIKDEAEDKKITIRKFHFSYINRTRVFPFYLIHCFKIEKKKTRYKNQLQLFLRNSTSSTCLPADYQDLISALLMRHQFSFHWARDDRFLLQVQRSLLASRSDSSNVRISPSRTGPLTFLISCLFCSFKNSTLTCVHCPWEPVLPRTFTTLARTIGFSMLSICRSLSCRTIAHV